MPLIDVNCDVIVHEKIQEPALLIKYPHVILQENIKLSTNQVLFSDDHHKATNFSLEA